MGRLYALAALAALLVPAILPDRQVSHVGSQDAVRAGGGPVPQVTVARVIPPRSLEDALTRVADRAREAVDREEHCLAQAVYFEARSEPLEGQLAVAQVVLNRVQSPLWPNSICGVVFQNEQYRHRCQFSFACDGRSDNPHNPRAWRIARAVAAVAVEGLWEDVTETSTHYHADYVAPYWKEILRPTVQHGRHVFYRDIRRASFEVGDPSEG